MRSLLITLVIAGALVSFPIAITLAQEKPASAATDAAELARKLTNPVASLISPPFQNHKDAGIGTYTDTKKTLNVQSVFPSKSQTIKPGVLPLVTRFDMIGDNIRHDGTFRNDILWTCGRTALVDVSETPAMLKKLSNGYLAGSHFHLVAQ